MHKFSTSLTIIIIVITIGLLPSAIAVVSSTVDTSASNGAVNGVSQRKTCFQSALYWAFYFNGSSLVWKTSKGGLAWSSATIARSGFRPGVDGTAWSIYCDGTYIHAAYNLGFAPLFYRRGLTNPDGSITWTAEQTVLTQAANSQAYPTITTDGFGHAWMGAMLYLAGKTKHLPYVLADAHTDGTWATATGFPYRLNGTANANWRVQVVPISGSEMGVYFVENPFTPSSPYNQPIYFRAYTGSDWRNQLTVPGGPALSSGFFSVVTDSSGNSNIVFTNSSEAMLLTTYSYAMNSFAHPKIVQTTVTSTTAAVLSINRSTGNMYAIWAGSPQANTVYYKKYTASSGLWDVSPTAITSATITANNDLTCFYQAGNGVIGVEYSTSTTAPYSVQFLLLQNI
jgi:hypothetical protein